MDPKWIGVLVMLVFFQKMASATDDRVVKEGDSVEIKCVPAEMFTMVIWFRVPDHSGMEFIGSFARDGGKKSTATPLSPNFSPLKMDKQILTLNAFKGSRDAGVYGCATIRNNELKFGRVTRLTGEKKAEVTTPAVTAKPNRPATTTACACKNSRRKGDTGLPVFCSTIILGPLAGGCGLLLLLLIVTILYCHKIRTRRCPHHYKRKPRTVAPGKQMMTNRNV